MKQYDFDRILQVNQYDTWGGAAIIGHTLHHQYLERGFDAWLAVGEQKTGGKQIITLPNTHRLQPFADTLKASNLPGVWRIGRAISKRIRRPHDNARKQGHEDFNYPGIWQLEKLLSNSPDIVHLHNLHGNYFDLRALPWLSKQWPVIVTLHDEWMLTGHCGYTLGCDRWKAGCGHCPDLTIYPPLQVDGTAFNWERKNDIYANSKLVIVTPSQWLMDRVKQSMLLSAAVETRVIHNGVNQQIFTPMDKRVARHELDLPSDAYILLFAAAGIRENQFKDYETLRRALEILGQRVERPTILLALGDEGPSEQVGNARLQFVPFQTDPYRIALHYQASDLYLHAARADTFPTVILESLACGTPVVATRVGGISEQVRNFDTHDKPTGILVEKGDASALATRVLYLLGEPNLHKVLSENAVMDARERFRLETFTQNYLDIYSGSL